MASVPRKAPVPWQTPCPQVRQTRWPATKPEHQCPAKHVRCAPVDCLALCALWPPYMMQIEDAAAQVVEASRAPANCLAGIVAGTPGVRLREQDEGSCSTHQRRMHPLKR